jgi:RNA polymerase subunit RPABC4/transcription elongation factor Spt4
MALIACSECGRAVSDKATVCIGCGAPLATTSSSIDLVAKPSKAPPPTREQIKRRALMALSMLAFGVIWTGFQEHRPGSRLLAFVAALLIIIGLCWLIVTLIHAATSRR